MYKKMSVKKTFKNVFKLNKLIKLNSPKSKFEAA